MLNALATIRARGVDLAVLETIGAPPAKALSAAGNLALRLIELERIEIRGNFEPPWRSGHRMARGRTARGSTRCLGHLATPSTRPGGEVSNFVQNPRVAGAVLSVLATAVVGAFAVANSTAGNTAVVGLAGVGGVATFAVSLSEPLRTKRHRMIATGIVLVATSVVASAAKEAASTRTGFFVASGAVLFCAAELADRSLGNPKKTEYLRGVDRFSTTSVLAVAALSSGLSYGVISLRGLFAGGGTAGLATGVAGATLVAFLVLLVLQSRRSAGP